MGEEVDIPALFTKEFEIGDRRLAARQDDKVGDRQRLARADKHEAHGGLNVQRVEVVEIGDARQHWDGDAHRAVDSRLPGLEAARRPRAGGGCGAQQENVRGQESRQCVCASSAIMPLRNRFASPRNLLTMKPTMVAASSGASAALTPRICAKMPPRSMSPTSATGQPAARAKPMFAMSPSRRLISAALPAPSTSTSPAFAFT